MANWWDRIDNFFGGALPGGGTPGAPRQPSTMNPPSMGAYQTPGYPGGGGYGGGFNPGIPSNVPLQTGVGLGAPGMGSALAQMAMETGPPMPNPGFVRPRGKGWGDPTAGIPQGGGSMGERIVQGLGDLGQGAMSFLGGNDGSNALMLAGLGMNAWDAKQNRDTYEEEVERARAEEEEQKKRYDSNNPARQALLASMYGRL